MLGRVAGLQCPRPPDPRTAATLVGKAMSAPHAIDDDKRL